MLPTPVSNVTSNQGGPSQWPTIEINNKVSKLVDRAVSKVASKATNKVDRAASRLASGVKVEAGKAVRGAASKAVKAPAKRAAVQIRQDGKSGAIHTKGSRLLRGGRVSPRALF